MTDPAQATATVTITNEMIQLAAEAIWNRRGGSAEMWSALAENYRDMARVALEAALAAAPPPAPSELEQAIAECKELGWGWGWAHVGNYLGTVILEDGRDFTKTSSSPEDALRQAMAAAESALAAGRSAGEGTSDA